MSDFWQWLGLLLLCVAMIARFRGYDRRLEKLERDAARARDGYPEGYR